MRRDDCRYVCIYPHGSKNHESTMQIAKIIIFYKKQAMYKILQYFLHKFIAITCNIYYTFRYYILQNFTFTYYKKLY